MDKMELKEIEQKINYSDCVSLTTTNKEEVVERLNGLEALGEAIKKALVEGVENDYGTIPNTPKPCLFQPGARKIVQLFGLSTQFENGHIETLNNKQMWLVKCVLSSRDGRIISESNGCALIGNKMDIGWETNKAIKMAQKRAMVGAVLQVSNLSKVFTQDTEDMEPNSSDQHITQTQNVISKQLGNDFYNKVKSIFKLDNDQTKIQVKQMVIEFNNQNGTNYSNIYQFTNNDYEKILKELGE